MAFVTDPKLKSYFLGTLVREDAERLEEECASDAELTERANIIESELSDAYLRRDLSGEERRLYEKNYLTTEARRGKLRRTKDLWKIVSEDRTTAKTPAPTFWQTLFARRRTLVFGGLAAIIIIGGGLILWQLEANRQPEIAERQNPDQSPDVEIKNQGNRETQSANINDSNSNANTDSENYNIQKGNKNIAPKSTVAPETKAVPKTSAPTLPTLATFALSPGTLRSEGEQFIKIAPNANRINLRLTVPKDAVKYQTYRAVLQTADGEIVFTTPPLKSPEIFLPSAKLKNQTYLVLLEGQNAADQAESVAEYTFRVSR